MDKMDTIMKDFWSAILRKCECDECKSKEADKPKLKEKSKEPKFKIGDRVAAYEINYKYYETITEYDPGDNTYKLDDWRWFHEKQLRRLVKKKADAISLVVDSFWKTRDGRKVYIYFKDDDGDFHGTLLNDDTIIYYNADGSHYNRHNRHLAIVAKWEG